MLGPDDRAALTELAPVLRRAVTLDPASLARLRLGTGAATVLVRLPFGVLVSRRVGGVPRTDKLDVTVRAAEMIAWLDAGGAAASEGASRAGGGAGRQSAEVAVPQARDAEWRTGLPPTGGWQRIETVPDEVIRGIVRAGALVLKEAAARERVPTAQPRAEVADALLDSTVLTVAADDGPATAAVNLRTLSALLRMGFLPRGGSVHVDLAGRWVRVVAEFGTVYLERPGQSLLVR
ncbi:MAG: hypothetical protein ABR571_00885 [Jatrophihabitans sp.]|uniref:hypothetical protein n=1 Tax=Jatrophihabitans sp. TaxID=1932789 RepID=UPI00391249AC